MRLAKWSVMVAAVVALLPGSLLAQAGSITGRVTGRVSGQPIEAVDVVVLVGGQASARTATDASGQFRFSNLSAGTYVVEVRRVGYQFGRVDNVVVQAGGTANVDVALSESVIQLDAIVVTVGREPEKQLDAPASVHVIQEVELRERPLLTVTDQIKNLPGVDASQGGLVQSNVVARGFNNIFSGATLVLVDNRFASVPSLRVNVPAFLSTTNEDIEQVEFVLGPGAALYGANSAKGVLAITTKSPFTSKGSSLWLESGFRAGSRDAADNALDDEQGIVRFGGRFAQANERVGFKVSGEYLKGTDWRYRDPAEPVSLPRVSPSLCSDDFGCRGDFNLEKWNVDARLDIRTTENSELIFAGGQNMAVSMIEPTGIGAGQARNWSYSYLQTRFRTGRLFLQGFGNFSDAGNTFLLRDGGPIVDNSRVFAGQAQYGFDLGSSETILFGVDYSQTVPRTSGTINGRNEDDDITTEIGGYVHSVTRLSDQIDLVGALRVDDHSRVEDLNISPRAAIVFKPSETQNIRFTYNRAFATPTSNNLFLDLVAGGIPGTPFKVRALGVPEGGFTFRGGNCAVGGVDNLCMRSPWPGAPTTLFPAQAAPMWAVAREAVIPAITAAALGPLAPFRDSIISALRAITTPTSAQVGTDLRTLDPTAGIFNEIDPTTVTDVAQLQPEITQVFEVGYKGILGDKFRLSIDGWLEKKKNFTGPLLVESPNVFLDLTTTAAYLTSAFPAALATRVPAAYVSAIATNLIPTLAGGMAGVSGQPSPATGVPLGTVVPDNALNDNADMFLTYRNFGNVNLWGADFAADYVLSGQWSIGGTFSYVSDDYFAAIDVDGPTDIALNASKSKASATVKYRQGVTGLSGEARVRYTKGFPINSGVYVTPLMGTTRAAIDNYTVADAQLAYRFDNGFLASFNVQNVLNTYYSTFVGVPQLGRLVMTKLQYNY